MQWVWVLGIWLVAAGTSAGTSAGVGVDISADTAPPDSMARPTRPKVFSSPEDLRSYLDQLGNFYAIAGRPRFGKRTLEPWMANYLGESRDNSRTLPWFRHHQQQQQFPITNTDVLQMLSSSNNF